MIDWLGFTWQAFATLSTGAMAVGSALFVGLKQVGIAQRQVGIAEKQAEIQRQQAETAQMTLREKLFERRFELFCDMEKAFDDAQKDHPNPFEMTPERSRVVLSARFLFPENVREALRPALEQFRVVKGVKEKKLSDESDEDHASRLKEAKAELRRLYRAFAERMEEYMRLYDVAAEAEVDSNEPQAVAIGGRSRKKWLGFTQAGKRAAQA